MGAAKCTIKGSDYVGVFATASDRHVFFGHDIRQRERDLICKELSVTPVDISVFGTDLVGLFVRANSKGIVLSNLIEDHELEKIKKQNLDLNIVVIGSGMNALGNNILLNDKIAIINPDYPSEVAKEIGDALGVEVFRAETGGFKTVGANNILTGKGLVVNNGSTDEQKEKLDKLTGFESTRTTANTGSLSIGLSTVANSKGVVAGEETTGFELERILEGLNIE